MKLDKYLNADPLPWLLEKSDPNVRYLTLRDIVGLAADAPELTKAKKAAFNSPLVNTILKAQSSDGSWLKPKHIYAYKYKGTVWSFILLAQLGLDRTVPQVAKATEHIFEYGQTPHGAFSVDGTPSKSIWCLHGNVCSSLIDLGYWGDERLDKAFDWLARVITGDGVAPMGTKDAPLRYYSGLKGPGFICGANNNQECAWGAIKSMLALSKIPPRNRTKRIKQAIEIGIDFLFSKDPAESDYPSGWNDKPSGNWWKFGFPVFYISDMLQNLEVLTRLGFGKDKRLKNAIQFLVDKQDDQGCWNMEYGYKGKMLVDIEKKGQPSKWVTLRALLVLSRL